jgi:hypothetical protein
MLSASVKRQARSHPATDMRALRNAGGSVNENENGWRIAVLCSVALASAGCAPADKEVGSACKNGVCPAALATEAPVCLAWDNTAQVQIVNAPDLPNMKLDLLCLPRHLTRDDSGKVPCTVTWTLLTDGSGDAPGHCSDLPFLTPSTDSTTCVVDQVAMNAGDASTAEGWYYGEEPAKQCSAALDPAAIHFTDAARAPEGVLVSLACAFVQEVAADGKLSSSDGEMCRLPSASAQDIKAVGEACLPKPVPEGGFSEQEVYVQTRSTECATGVCLAFHLNGDPTPGCTEADAGDTPACGARRLGDGAHPECEHAPRCADPKNVDDRVYCSCRCKAPDGADECKCPSGFVCIDALQNAHDTLRGGYCVRDGT